MDRKFVAAENVVFVVVSCVVCMVPADRAVTSGPLRTVDTVIEGHGLAVYEIEIVLPLQLSWLRPLSTRLTVRPLQDPTFVPVGTTFAPLVPPMAKSAWVQAGLAPFVCELKASTVAVIDEIPYDQSIIPFNGSHERHADVLEKLVARVLVLAIVVAQELNRLV